jgi:hypothetical protein
VQVPFHHKKVGGTTPIRPALKHSDAQFRRPQPPKILASVIMIIIVAAIIIIIIGDSLLIIY